MGISDRVTRIQDGAWMVQKNGWTVQIVAAPEFVVVTCKVLDKAPTQNREAFFRRLLAANVELMGAFFTLESNESIRLNQVHPIEFLPARALAFMLGNVAAKADDWNDRLKALSSD